MFLALWWSAKALFTILARVRLYSWVSSFMFLASWWSDKALLTILACIGLHSCASWVACIRRYSCPKMLAFVCLPSHLRFRIHQRRYWLAQFDATLCQISSLTNRDTGLRNLCCQDRCFYRIFLTKWQRKYPIRLLFTGKPETNLIHVTNWRTQMKNGRPFVFYNNKSSNCPPFVAS